MNRVVLITWALIAAVATAAPLEFKSPATKVPLLELYTSEGCSSCPPAETWLNKLANQEDLWRTVVPVEFHVTYWDRLGWKDRFALEAADVRQHSYADTWHAKTVYTPAFMLDGGQWNGWRYGRQPSATTSERVGTLLAILDDDVLRVTFRPTDTTPRVYTAHVAILAFDQKVNVKAGENKGRRLTHDFAVYRYLTEDIRRSGTPVPMRLPPKWRPEHGRVAIAVWITPANLPIPVQATGGWVSSGLTR